MAQNKGNIFETNQPDMAVAGNRSFAYLEAAAAEGAKPAEAIANLGKTLAPSAIKEAAYQTARSDLNSGDKGFNSVEEKLTTFDDKGNVEYAGPSAATAIKNIARIKEETRTNLATGVQEAEATYASNVLEGQDVELAQQERSASLRILENSLGESAEKIKIAESQGIISRQEALSRLEVAMKKFKASNPTLAAAADEYFNERFGSGIATLSIHKALFTESGEEKAKKEAADATRKAAITWYVEQRGVDPLTAASVVDKNPQVLAEYSTIVQNSRFLERRKTDAENAVKAQDAVSKLTTDDAVRYNTATIADKTYKIAASMEDKIKSAFGESTTLADLYQGGQLKPQFWSKQAQIDAHVVSARQQIDDAYEAQIQDFVTKAKRNPSITGEDLSKEVKRLRTEKEAELKVLEKPEGFARYMKTVQTLAKDRVDEAQSILNIQKTWLGNTGGDSLIAAYIENPENVKQRYPFEYGVITEVFNGSSNTIKNLGLVAGHYNALQNGEVSIKETNPQDPTQAAAAVNHLRQKDQVINRLAEGGKQEPSDTNVLVSTVTVPAATRDALKNSGQFVRAVNALDPASRARVQAAAAEALNNQKDPSYVGGAMNVLMRTVQEQKDGAAKLSLSNFKIDPVSGEMKYTPPKIVLGGKQQLRGGGSVLAQDYPKAAVEQYNQAVRVATLVGAPKPTEQVKAGEASGYKNEKAMKGTVAMAEGENAEATNVKATIPELQKEIAKTKDPATLRILVKELNKLMEQ